MNNQYDTLSILSNYSLKVVDYATDVITEGNQFEIDRLFKYYPELLYHQYNKGGYWNDFAWNYVYEYINQESDFKNDILLSRLRNLKKLNYVPSGMFRERLMAQSIKEPFILEEYIKLFENDTTKVYKDINNNSYSSLLELFLCFSDNFEDNKKNNKKLISMLVKNSTFEINKENKYGSYTVERLLSNSVFLDNPIILFRLIDKGMKLKCDVESRNKLAVEYFKNNGMKEKVKKHSFFNEDDCIVLPLIQSLLFDYGRDNKNYSEYSNKKIKVLNELIKIVRKGYPELEEENKKILSTLNINALNDIYY
tara:strand:- start:10272 stop:11198 length:927 start_codon:yes stop_codon:yes gene_type:complete